MCIYDLDYSYRLYAWELYPKDPNVYKIYFDVFILSDDKSFESFYAHENLWRETILFKYLNN